MPDIGDRDRIGNPAIDPATGSPLAVPPDAFTTGGTPTDPTTVLLTIRQPDGELLVYGWPAAGPDGTLTKESTPGRFYAELTYQQAGTYRYRLEGTGAVTAAEEGWVRVTRSEVLA